MKFLKSSFLIAILLTFTLITSCVKDDILEKQEQTIEQTTPDLNSNKNAGPYPGDCDIVPIWAPRHYNVGEKVRYRSNNNQPYTVYERTHNGWKNLGVCSDNPNPGFSISVATRGNSWVIGNPAQTNRVVTGSGIRNWNNSNITIRTYFYITSPGTYSLGINARVQSGNSKIEASFGGTSNGTSTTKQINVSNTGFQDISIGNLQVSEKGYYYVDLKGISKTSGNYADVNSVRLGGNASNSNIKYIKNDTHFGRRGPSVHLKFSNPSNNNIQAFYNEIEIEPGQDVIGSYFNANGFNYGYFGIQVNSSSERRVLFSVWSPYSTNDPGSVPPEYRIKLLKKGAGVYTGQFGGEGAGGQSYKVYNWKAGVRYKFLLLGKPAGNNKTDFTAYFMDPSRGTWDLIASFRRPKTNTYLGGLYSFLENFHPNRGDVQRKAGFYNQWVYDTSNNWHEVTNANFTYDATASNGFRWDYFGRSNGKGFELKNCGFFSTNTSANTQLRRSSTSASRPQINFSTLE
ncbi:DUF3472 domain-containing protein [Aquimarina sediminis]|uniref:DUF3472 domain-containing protein n=1 Tax=Aquimarina sediminis TaxID=2070536 RepID=UPI000CA05D17|nr:DUF3472 domain-containing protein [Aquimarina sediminis]